MTIFSKLQQSSTGLATLQSPLASAATDFLAFGYKQAMACIFGALMLLGILLTKDLGTISGWTRNDFLFLYALGLQFALIALRLEHGREVGVILAFHILATFMEWFKTSPEIASWQYPSDGAIFRVYQVPLFAGFLYSAVGSYIARSWRLMSFRFDHYPPVYLTVILAVAAYLNFFTHHYIVDIRWFLIAFSIVLFGRTTIYFRPNQKYYKMPLLLGLMLVALFIWFAENIGTFARAWAYPNQANGWDLVHPSKITAWFLLMMLSFVLVSLLQLKTLRPPSIK